MRRVQGYLGSGLAGVALALILLLSACDLTPPAPSATPSAEEGSRPSGSAPETGSFGTGSAPETGSVGTGDQANAPTATLPSGSFGSAAPTAAPPALTAGTQGVAPAVVKDGGPTATAVPPASPPGLYAIAVKKETLRGQIAYVGVDGDIWLMDRAATQWRRIIDNPAASVGPTSVAQRLHWSPNGIRLLYTVTPSVGGQPHRLFSWNAETGVVSDLGPVVGETRSVGVPTGAWLPDSTLVAVARPDGNVVVRDIDKGTDVVVGLGVDPAWVPATEACGMAQIGGGGPVKDPIAVVRDNNLWLLDYPPHPGGEHQLTHFAAPGAATWAVDGTLFLWNCQVLFYGDPAGGLGAQSNGMAVYAVSLRSGAVLPKPLLDRGGRDQLLAVSPDGNYLALTENYHVDACISAGAARVVPYNGGKASDVLLPVDVVAYHTHTYGLTWGPRGVGGLIVAYSQHSCERPDPASPSTLKDITGARMMLYNVDGLTKPKYLGDGTWPAWNGGTVGLGTAPAPRER